MGVWKAGPLGIWSDVWVKSHILRIDRFVPYAVSVVRVAERPLLPMVPDFSRFDPYGRRRCMCMVPDKFHSAVPASQLRDGTDLLRRIK